MIAREDESFFFEFASVFVLFFVDLEMDESGDQIKEAVTLEDFFPEVGGAIIVAVRIGWVSGSALVALVEGEEAGGGSGKAGGHPDKLGIDGEVGEGAAFEFKEGFAGISIVAILSFGVFGGLSGEGIFEFEGDDRDAVEAEGEVDDAVFCPGAWEIGGFRFFVGFAVLELAGDGELVGLVVGFEFGVEGVSGFEGGDVESTSVAFEAVAQDLECAVGV